MVDEPTPQNAAEACPHCPSPAECACPDSPAVCRTRGCVCPPSCPCWWQDYPGCFPGSRWKKKKKKKKKPGDEDEPKRRKSVTTRPSGLGRPGCLPIVVIIFLVGIIGLVFLLNRGGGDPGSAVAPTTTTAVATTTTTTTTTTTMAVAVATSTAVTESSTTTSPPVVTTVPPEFGAILGHLGVPPESLALRYAEMMGVDPILRQSGPNLIDTDDHLMLERYTHFEVTLDEDQAASLRSHVTGDPVAGGYLIFVGETRSGEPVTGTRYQYALILSATNELLAPFPGEIGPLGRITGAFLAWFLDQSDDGYTLSAFGLPDFVSFASNAFGYSDGAIFVFGIPVAELPSEYTAYLETFGRNSPGEPAAEDPAGYVLTDGYHHG